MSRPASRGTLHGAARLADEHTVEIVGEGATRRLSAEFVLVATGSTPFHPPDIPFDDPDVDDSDSILRMDRLPESLGVIGAGVIGCEYASMFAALGCKVTLIEPRNELLSFLDADMSEALRLALIAHGIDVRLETGAGPWPNPGTRLPKPMAPEARRLQQQRRWDWRRHHQRLQ